MMDELKDRKIDQYLFSERPLPSGRVLESDLSFSLFIVIILYLLVNIWNVKIFCIALFALIYTLLMFKYFFFPGLLRKYLLLNLATHNPIIPILLFYLLALFNAEHNLSFNDLDWKHSLLLIFLYWLLFFAWEIARKIRCQKEENAYVTYSRIFGRLGAILIAGGAQTAVLLIALYIYHTFTLSSIFIIIILLAYTITIFGYLRFIYKPNVKHNKLRTFAEFYVLSCFLAVVSELIIFLLVRSFDYAPL
jgi:4-hydroxybenzoate polyprenyltransferase